MRQATFLTLLALLVAPFGFGQTITYLGIEIQPGDVFTFQGGVFTVDQRYLTYGHSALYLGLNPEMGQRSFLDFTATEEYLGGESKKDERAFVGRILSEREFLEASAKSHSSFDVFRLRDVSTLDQQRMLKEAMLISTPDHRFWLDYVCASAVATVLSRATGRTNIVAKTPDDLTRGLFVRHPQLTGKSINIQAALNEMAKKEMDLAMEISSKDFLTSIPPEAVQSRKNIQADWTDHDNWLRSLEETVSRAEETERQLKAENNFKRELLKRADAFGYLVAAAGMACGSPETFLTEVREGRYSDVSMEREYLTVYLGIVAGISPCQFEILNKINNSESSVSWRELQTWGSQYRAVHPSNFHRAVQALGAFRDSFRDFVAHIIPNPASTSPQSPHADRTDRTDHSQHAPNVMGTPPARQLRGIASGGWN